MLQTKEQDKTQKKTNNEIKMSNIPDKKSKVMVIKMLTKLKRKIDEHTENIDKEIENIRNTKEKSPS